MSGEQNPYYQDMGPEDPTVRDQHAITDTSNTATGGGQFTIPKMDVGDVEGSLVVLFAASLVEMIAAARTCDEMDGDCDKMYGFAVALGVVSLVFVPIYVLILRFLPNISSNVTPIFAIFLVVWWTIGAGICTFNTPFRYTGNGYFACWLALGASCLFASKAVPQFQALLDHAYSNTAGGGPARLLMAAILVGSVVVMIASSVAVDETGKHGYKKGQKAWGVAVGVLSLVISAVTLFVPGLDRFTHFVAAFLALMWTFGAGVLTFDSPFIVTGNGFFASWVCYLSSWYLAFLTFISSSRNV